MSENQRSYDSYLCKHLNINKINSINKQYYAVITSQYCGIIEITIENESNGIKRFSNMNQFSWILIIKNFW